MYDYIFSGIVSSYTRSLITCFLIFRSSKFETDKLQKNKSLERDLSFTDIARIRVSQSQLPKPEVDQSHDTFCYSPSQSITLQSKSAVMPNVSEAQDEGVVSTSSAIIPNRNPPNGNHSNHSSVVVNKLYCL